MFERHCPVPQVSWDGSGGGAKAGSHRSDGSGASGGGTPGREYPQNWMDFARWWEVRARPPFADDPSLVETQLLCWTAACVYESIPLHR